VTSTGSDYSIYLRDPDVQRMLRVKEGDEGAFAELVAAYQDRIVGIFSHLLNDPSAAEDLAQDVFLRVYRARHRYQPSAKFGTWLFHIANNLAVNRRVSVARRREISLAGSESGPLGLRPEEQLATSKSAFMPGRQLDKSEMRALIQQALGMLNERQRMALLLNKFEHMSYADIATTMDMTEKAVKSLLMRARENLKGYLEPYI